MKFHAGSVAWLVSVAAVLCACAGAGPGGGNGDPPTDDPGGASGQGTTAGQAGANAGRGGATTGQGGAGSGGSAGDSAGQVGTTAGASGKAGATGAPANDAAITPPVKNDAGTDALAPPPVSGCAGATFCDQFDNYPLNTRAPAPWKLDIADGMVLVDKTRAFSGTQSLHAFTTSGGQVQKRAYAALAGAPVFPKPWTMMYGRMMLWVDQVVDSHWTNVEGEGRVPQQTFSAVTRYGGQYKKIIAQYDDVDMAGLTDCAKRSPVAVLPEKRWVCYEWQFDTRNNAMRLWLDGAEVTTLAVNGRGDVCLGNATGNKWLLPEYDSIRVGWQNYQQAPLASVWIDDFAVGPTRVGCPK